MQGVVPVPEMPRRTRRRKRLELRRHRVRRSLSLPIRNRAAAEPEPDMTVNLNQLGQVALPVSDVDRAEEFFSRALGLRKLFRFGDLCFFDMGGVRLLVEKGRSAADVARAS